MNTIIREAYGILFNPLNGNHDNKELVLHFSLSKQLTKIEYYIDLLTNSLVDELTPFYEAFPKLAQENPSIPSSTQNFYDEYFTNSIVKSIMEDQAQGIVTSSREPLINVAKTLNNFMQSNSTVIVPNKTGGFVQYFNSVADITLKKILQKILDFSIIENLDMADLGIVALKLLTFSFIFRGTVKLYVKVAYPQVSKTVEEAVLRRKEIRFFMVYGAIPISLAIYNIGHLTLRNLLMDRVLEEVSIYTHGELEQLGKYIQNGISKLGVLSFLGGQTPNWLILIILLLLIIAYYNPYSISHCIFNWIQMYNNTFIILILLGQILMLLYYIMSFVFVQITLNNKVILSNNLPKLIRFRLLFYSNLTNEEKNSFSRSYKINIIIYVCVFIFTLLMYLLGVYN